MNYYELLNYKAKEYPEKVFLYIDNDCYTYGRFLDFVNSLANDYCSVKKGILKGEVILITEKGFLQQAGAFLAYQKLGAVPVLLHQGINTENIEKNIRTDNSDDNVMGALTSGSTGAPKILYRTYFSWAGFFPEQNDIFGIDANSITFIHGSLSFTGNLNILMSVLFAGGTAVTSSHLNGKRWYKLLQHYQVNSLYMVPAKLQILAEASKERYTGLKHIITGSQLVSEKCRSNLYKAFPQVELIMYYGASELSYITYKKLAIEEKLQVENLGKPFKDIKLNIIDDVIFVDTPYHISGIKTPYSCQDTGYIDENGNLIFQGRRTQWVNKGGYKVSCLKLENKIKALDDVSDAVILPCHDELRGQEIAAFVVMQENDELSQEQLSEKKRKFRQQLRRSLDVKEMPKIIKFVAKIPLNDRGKVDKEALLCGI